MERPLDPDDIYRHPEPQDPDDAYDRMRQAEVDEAVIGVDVGLADHTVVVTAEPTSGGSFKINDFISMHSDQRKLGHPMTLYAITGLRADEWGSELTVKWFWWREPWFRYLVGGLIATALVAAPMFL